MTLSAEKSDKKIISYCLSIHYESDYGKHSDHLYVQKNNLCAVMESLPAVLKKDIARIKNTEPYEEAVRHDYIKGSLFNNDESLQTVSITLEDFKRHPGRNITIEPRAGRFYPAGLFNSPKLLINNRMMPLRVIQRDHEELLINTSHALCNYDITFSFKANDEQQDAHYITPGITSKTLQDKQIPDFMTGPGMQLRHAMHATDFFSDAPYQRDDDSHDAIFYSNARYVDHLDEIALIQLRSLYSKLIPAHAVVVDLMSSINSHLEVNLPLEKVIGIGMNKEELAANPRLDEFIVHDINAQQTLPLDDACCDTVICSLSIEYLTQPAQIFDEVARILRPGGRFVISFSNRWFPTKSIQLWNNLHDFERIGVVMEYFIESAHFTKINTCSLRGIPRAVDDKHDIPLSDPVYALWANKT